MTPAGSPVRVQQVRAKYNPCRSHAQEDRENEDVVVGHGANGSKKKRGCDVCRRRMGQ
jgi:hypothetical protein